MFRETKNETETTNSTRSELNLLPRHHLWLAHGDNLRVFQERMEQNLNSCQEHIQQTPDAASYNFLGVIYYYQKKLDEAEQCFQKALEIEPNNSIALTNLIYLCRDKSLFEKAQVYFSRVKQFPNIGIHTSKAYFHIRLFQYPEALKEYDLAIQINPNNDKAHLYKGICLNRLAGLPENKSSKKSLALEAISHLEKAGNLIKPKEDSIIYTHLGRAYGYAENSSKALEYFEKALTIKPDDENTLKFLAKLHLNQYHYRYALSLLDRVISVKPTTSAYHNRGILHWKKKRFGLATHDLEEAIKLQNNNIAARFDLIKLYVETKQWSKVISSCCTINESHFNSFQSIVFFWAEALDNIREYEGAKNKYKKFLEYANLYSDQQNIAKKWLLEYYGERFSQTKDVLYISESIRLCLKLKDKDTAWKIITPWIDKEAIHPLLAYILGFMYFNQEPQDLTKAYNYFENAYSQRTQLPEEERKKCEMYYYQVCLSLAKATNNEWRTSMNYYLHAIFVYPKGNEGFDAYLKFTQIFLQNIHNPFSENSLIIGQFLLSYFHQASSSSNSHIKVNSQYFSALLFEKFKFYNKAETILSKLTQISPESREQIKNDLQSIQSKRNKLILQTFSEGNQKQLEDINEIAFKLHKKILKHGKSSDRLKPIISHLLDEARKFLDYFFLQFCKDKFGYTKQTAYFPCVPDEQSTEPLEKRLHFYLRNIVKLPDFRNRYPRLFTFLLEIQPLINPAYQWLDDLYALRNTGTHERKIELQDTNTRGRIPRQVDTLKLCGEIINGLNQLVENFHLHCSTSNNQTFQTDSSNNDALDHYNNIVDKIRRHQYPSGQPTLLISSCINSQGIFAMSQNHLVVQPIDGTTATAAAAAYSQYRK